MCMALPAGKPQNPPPGVLGRCYQWAGFGLLLIRLFTAALVGQFRYHWYGGAN